MPGVRELLAVVLGVLLGVALITVPQTALRLSVFVGPNRRRRGDYGTDNHDLLSDQWTLLICGLGVVCLAIALFITYQTYA